MPVMPGIRWSTTSSAIGVPRRVSRRIASRASGPEPAATIR